MSFHVGEFEPAFTVAIDPEFPGDADWKCRVVGFDRDGAAMDEFDSRWGTPFIIRIEPEEGDPWIAMFAAGGIGSLRGVFATPSPTALVVVADGRAYLVDVDLSTPLVRTVHDQVHQVAATSDPPLLLLVRFIDIVAIGPDGVAWATPRLCVDDLKVVRADRTAIECSCDNLDGTSTITLDPHTGKQTGGTRVDSFWPPDAPA
jgi:hypothetical protein